MLSLQGYIEIFQVEKDGKGAKSKENSMHQNMEAWPKYGAFEELSQFYQNMGSRGDGTEVHIRGPC